MKLLIVTPYFAPAWGYGGPPKLLWEFAKAMVDRGHQVTIATTDALDRHRIKSGRQDVDDLTIYRFRNLSNRLAWRQKIFLPIGLRNFLVKTVNQYDFVFCSDLRHLLNIFTFEACRTHHTPFGLAAFGELSITADWKRPFKQIYDQCYGKSILRQARLLFAQTNSEQNGYRSFIGEHPGIVLWPLAINLQPYRHLPPPGQFRKYLRLAPDDLIVVSVSRFHPYKGLDYLIDAHHRLLQTFPHLKLVLIGRDDGALSDLHHRVAELDLGRSVLFPGPLYNQEVIAAYRDADVFALTPTHDEQTPLAGIMALAAGCPVVVTKNASIPWLADYQAGLTIDQPTDLVGALQMVLSDATLRRSMSRAARRLAFRRYGWPARAQAFEQLLSKSLTID